ncbi:hypothetical protein C8R44DRAFT_982980 [Mycena epipterygia]|nr:hypothetical protein C8R44DRAFT_982980 [Mycena epipterygia]
MGHGHALLTLFLKLYIVLSLAQAVLSANLPIFAPNPPPAAREMPLSPRVVSRGQLAPLYGQCGGIGWTGPTTCVPGAVCQAQKQNPYYSQCLAATTPTTTPESTPTKTSTPVSPPTSTAPSPPTSSPDSSPLETSTPGATTAVITSVSSAANANTDATASSPTTNPSSATSSATNSGNAGQKSGVPDAGPAAILSAPDGSLSSSSVGSSFTGSPANLPVNSGPSNTATNFDPASDPTPSPGFPVAASAKSKSSKAPVIAGVLVPILLLLLGAAGFVLYKRRQRARDRREWERTHAEIADAVRQVGGSTGGTPPYAGSVWSRVDLASRGDAMGFTAAHEKGSGDAVTDPFIDSPVAQQHADDSARPSSRDFDPYGEQESRPASSMDSASI